MIVSKVHLRTQTGKKVHHSFMYIRDLARLFLPFSTRVKLTKDRLCELYEEMCYFTKYFSGIYYHLFSKGQSISECLLDNLNFSKKPTKNLTNFCPRI